MIVWWLLCIHVSYARAKKKDACYIFLFSFLKQVNKILLNAIWVFYVCVCVCLYTKMNICVCLCMYAEVRHVNQILRIKADELRRLNGNLCCNLIIYSEKKKFLLFHHWIVMLTDCVGYLNMDIYVSSYKIFMKFVCIGFGIRVKCV